MYIIDLEMGSKLISMHHAEEREFLLFAELI